MAYKMMKVFDCQDMPEDVREAFFDYEEAQNDVYVYWMFREYPKGSQKIVQKWLSDNGADSEDVLINHWW